MLNTTIIRYKKKKIPKALRQQVWLKYNGEEFNYKCNIVWCRNIITVFNFHVGHNIPESRGGSTCIENLRPICSNCNLSMSSKYSISEWDNNFKNNSKRISLCNRICNYFFSK